MKQESLGAGLSLFQSAAWQMSSLVLDLGGETLVVDPGYFPEEVDQLASALAACGPQPARLLLTHSHFDHVAGLPALPPLPVIAHARLGGNQPSRVAKALTDFDGQLYVERAGSLKLPTPAVPVSAPLTLAAGRDRLHLCPAPGHSVDCLFTVIERAGLFLPGDYLSELEFPFLGEEPGSLSQYLETLTLALRLIDDFRPRLLVPGHGPTATTLAAMKERARRDQAYLENLNERVEACVRQGASLRQTQSELKGLPYRGEPVRAALLASHRTNVVRHYRSLT